MRRFYDIFAVFAALLALYGVAAAMNPAPLVTSVEWASDAWSITIEFNNLTNMYDKTANESFACTEVLEFPASTSIGTDGYCTFPDRKTLRIFLGGDSVSLLPVPSPTLTILLNRIYLYWQPSLSVNSAHVVNASAEVPPVVRTECYPSCVIGRCDAVTLSAAFSDIRGRGYPGVAPAYSWSVVTAPVGLGNISISSPTARAITFSGGDLRWPGSYVFNVTLYNLFQTSTIEQVEVTVLDYIKPILSIYGPDEVVSSAESSFSVDVARSPCKNDTVFVYKWSVFNGSGVRVVDFGANSASAFVIPAKSLPSVPTGSLFSVSVNVSYADDETSWVSGSKNFSVFRSPPVAVLLGSGRWAQGDNVTLDASYSYDSWGGTSHFSLVCYQGSSPCTDSSSVPIGVLESDNGVFRFTPNTFAPGWYKFNLTYNSTDGGNTYTAKPCAIDVEIVLGRPPHVEILLPRQINAHAAVSLSAVTSLEKPLFLWTSETVVPDPTLDLANPSNLLSGLDGESLLIAPFALSAGKVYHFRCQVWDASDPFNVASDGVTVKVNDLPRPSSSEVHPLYVESFSYPGSSIAFQSKFAVSVGTWEDLHGPLDYSFGYKDENGLNITITVTSPAKEAILLLPSGWKSGSVLPVCVWAHDALGAIGSYCVDTVVQPPSDVSAAVAELMSAVAAAEGAKDLFALGASLTAAGRLFNSYPGMNFTSDRSNCALSLSSLTGIVPSIGSLRVLLTAVRELTANTSELSRDATAQLIETLRSLIEPSWSDWEVSVERAFLESVSALYEVLAAQTSADVRAGVTTGARDGEVLTDTLNCFFVGKMSNFPCGSEPLLFVMRASSPLQMSGARLFGNRLAKGQNVTGPSDLLLRFPIEYEPTGFSCLSVMMVTLDAVANPYADLADVTTGLFQVSLFPDNDVTKNVDLGDYRATMSLPVFETSVGWVRECLYWNRTLHRFEQTVPDGSASWISRNFTECPSSHFSSFAVRDWYRGTNGGDSFPTWATVLIFFSVCGFIGWHIVMIWAVYANRRILRADWWFWNKRKREVRRNVEIVESLDPVAGDAEEMMSSSSDGEEDGDPLEPGSRGPQPSNGIVNMVKNDRVGGGEEWASTKSSTRSDSSDELSSTDDGGTPSDASSGVV